MSTHRNLQVISAAFADELNKLAFLATTARMAAPAVSSALSTVAKASTSVATDPNARKFLVDMGKDIAYQGAVQGGANMIANKVSGQQQ